MKDHRPCKEPCSRNHKCSLCVCILNRPQISPGLISGGMGDWGKVSTPGYCWGGWLIRVSNHSPGVERSLYRDKDIAQQ